jgi:general secretion pathway protein G
MSGTPKKQAGFTIVELLIVIVVIAILATISIVAYNGIQARSRDSIRKQDLATLVKATQLYYVDKGDYVQ